MQIAKVLPNIFIMFSKNLKEIYVTNITLGLGTDLTLRMVSTMVILADSRKVKARLSQCKLSI